jgi:hypothetical protein
MEWRSSVRNYGLESINSSAAAFGITTPEVANQPSWILFRQFAVYFEPARHKR